MKRMTLLGILLSLIVLVSVSHAVIQPADIEIDIKPGSFPNSINVTSAGVIPVAILGSEVFDTADIEPATVRFGPGGADEAHGKGHVEDVNDDGLTDLVFHFYIQDTGLVCGDVATFLIGETFSGETIGGIDFVNIVECN